MRVFIGIDLPENIKENLKGIIERVKKIREAKPVKLENLHITLKFLGEVEEKKVNIIQGKIEKFVKEIESFEVEVKGVGVFPSEKKPRVLWVGVEDKENLKKLNNRIEETLSEFGFEKEKDFVSHITVSRFRSTPNKSFIEEILGKFKDAVFGKFKITDFCFYESNLTPEGPIYKIIGKINLRR